MLKPSSKKTDKTAIVTGAGGFIGSHFTRFLKEKGYFVIGIDVKAPEFSVSCADQFILADLRDIRSANQYIRHCNELYMFAANMGGIGYIERIHAPVMRDNVMINANCLEAARLNGVNKVFFASSACVYPLFKQKSAKFNSGLSEKDVYPAQPEPGYGWEKLFSENMCLAYARDYGLYIRIARFHNIYGPESTYKGGKEKSPAAICRKIAQAPKNDLIEIWGDGRQVRSYCYIKDCCDGVFRLMHSNCDFPLNIGSSEKISINSLAKMIASIAGKEIKIKHRLDGPQGVRGRSSNNTLIRRTLGWEPTVPLKVGMKENYLWVQKQIERDRFKRKLKETDNKKVGISIK